MSDVDHFNYLRNLVEGPAYSTIAGLQLTGANYKSLPEFAEGEIWTEKDYNKLSHGKSHENSTCLF